MKNRSRQAALSPLLLGALAMGLILSSCTSNVSNDPSEYADSSSALEYVNSLRGENDLAHGSLELPSQTNLPGFAASVALQRRAGVAEASASDSELKELSAQISDDPSWSAMYLCTATGNNSNRVKQILGSQINSIQASKPSVQRATTNENELANYLASIQAKSCLSGKEVAEKLSLTDSSKLAKLTQENPLLAAKAKLVLGESTVPTLAKINTQALIPKIENQLSTDGCQGWVWATSVSLKFVTDAQLTPKVEACATNFKTVIKEPTALQYVVDGGLSANDAKQLIDANQVDIKRWTTLSSSTLSSKDRPTGLGTLQYTRDAITFLRLRGVRSYPGWMKNGVVKAAESLDSSAPQEDKFDLLFSCAALSVSCKQSVIDDAKSTLSKQLANFVPTSKYDLALARAIDTAGELKMEISGKCVGASAGWIRDSPQVLAALLSSDKECKKIADVGDEKLKSYYSSAIARDDYESALGYVLIESLVSNQHDEVTEFGKFAMSEFDKLADRVSKEQGKDFVSEMRPIRLELAKAKIVQWTS